MTSAVLRSFKMRYHLFSVHTNPPGSGTPSVYLNGKRCGSCIHFDKNSCTVNGVQKGVKTTTDYCQHWNNEYKSANPKGAYHGI